MRHRIELLLEELGHFTYRRAWLIITATLLLIAVGATQIPSIVVRTSVDEFLGEGDPTKIDYDAFLDQFGRDDMMLVAIEPPEVFDLAFLGKLREFHDALEDEVPHVKEVQSLITARETRGHGDSLIVGELFEDWPENAEELASIRERALANPLYVDFILSRDAKLTIVSVELEAYAEEFDDTSAFTGFDETHEDQGMQASTGTPHLTGAQEVEAVEAVGRVVSRFDAEDFRINTGGMPVLNTAMMKSLLMNVARFTLLSTLMIATLLAVVFRRALGVFIPLATAILSLVATLGAMATLGIPAMPISEVVPSFLLSIGVGSTVHLITIFLQQIELGASREEAIAKSLAHSGLPIIMTGLTTAGGIISFAAASLLPVAIFGIVGALGIILCLVLTIVLVPALLAVVPMRMNEASATAPGETAPRSSDETMRLSEEGGPDDSPSVRALVSVGDFATRRPWTVLGTCASLVVIALVGILRLEVSFDSLEWFPDDMPAKVASRKIDEKFGGGMALEVVVDTREQNGLHDPDLLQALDRARHTLHGLPVGSLKAGRSLSLVDILKEIHRALNEGRADAYVVPDDRNLISQELILFENSGSDDLEDVVDSEFRKGRFTVRVPMVDALYYLPFSSEVERILRKALPEGSTVTQTGIVTLMGRTLTASIETMFRSYVIALLVITPLMMLLLGSFRLGLIAMIPNLFPIVLTLGLMGWTSQPLEMFSLLIGSVALGLAVDDTIHFMHGFRKRYAETGNVETAVRGTLRTTGQALFFTSVVLTFGFLIYLFSDLNNLTRFGSFTAFSIVTAFLADVLLAPALMKITAEFSSLGRAGDRSTERIAA